MQFFKKRNKVKENVSSWKLTDTILNIEDIVYELSLEIDDMENFVCLRCSDFTCIYVPKDKIDNFLSSYSIYDKDKSIVNISELKKYKLESNVSANVSNKTVPQSVSIKEIIICKLYNYIVYIEKLSMLDGSDDLFKDLINLQMIKEKYNLTIK